VEYSNQARKRKKRKELMIRKRKNRKSIEDLDSVEKTRVNLKRKRELHSNL
jgi:hypothetical protein